MFFLILLYYNDPRTNYHPARRGLMITWRFRDIYSCHFPPFFCPNWKTGKNLQEDLKKGREKGGKEGKKEKSDKTHDKIPLWSLNTAKNAQKQGRILEGGGEEFIWLARIYTNAMLKTNFSSLQTHEPIFRVTQKHILT